MRGRRPGRPTKWLKATVEEAIDVSTTGIRFEVWSKWKKKDKKLGTLVVSVRRAALVADQRQETAAADVGERRRVVRRELTAAVAAACGPDALGGNWMAPPPSTEIYEERHGRRNTPDPSSRSDTHKLWVTPTRSSRRRRRRSESRS